MSMIVEDILQLGEFKNAAVLAGESGLEREIQAAEVMEVPDINEWLTEGILLISTFYSVKDQPEKQISMFRRLIEVKGAGLIVKIGRYVHSLPEEMIELANKYHMPIITIPVDVSFVHLLTTLFEKKFREGHALETELLDQVYKLGESKHLDSFLEQLSVLTRENAYIENQDQQLLAWANETKTMERRSFTLFAQPDASHEDQHTFRLRFMELEEGDSLTVVIGLSAQEQIWRTVLHKATTFLEEQLRFLINKKLTAIRDVLEAQEYQLEEIQGDSNEIEHVSYAVISIAFEQKIQKNALSQSFFFEQIYTLAYLHWPTTTITYNQEKLTVLFECSKDHQRGDAVSAFNDFSVALIEKTGIKSRAGFSEHHSTYSMLKQAMEEAKTSVLQSSNEQIIVLYEQLGVERVLAKLRNDEDLQLLAEGIIKKLEEGGSDSLVLTLSVFLEENGNHSKTAERLFIHRRTLKYRLNKIEKQLSMDLHSSKTRFILYLALKINKQL